jgi:hypothetical protein
MARLAIALIAVGLAFSSLSFARAANPTDTTPSETVAAPAEIATATAQPTPALTPTPSVWPAYLPVIFRQPDPGATPHILTRSQQGFDTCEFPSLTTLTTWWNKSPYRSVGFYLGGPAFANCSRVNVTQANLTAEDAMGWTFMLIWVGLQAPCGEYKSKMSSDANTAYAQGREQADKAVAAAKNLGFPSDLAIYDDMEESSNSDSACRNAVLSYIGGWTSRLHELNNKAGIYSGMCSGFVTEWATSSYRPDFIWLYSDWPGTWGYDAKASAYSIPCISDGTWSHQRIRQYAAWFNNTWGGKTLAIDANVIEGAVQAYGSGGLVAAPAAEGFAIQSGGPQIADAQLVAPGRGWALVDGALLWTDDAGVSWTPIGSPTWPEGSLLDVSFIDAAHGWAAVQPAQGGTLSLWRTSDGGKTWSAGRLSMPEAAGLKNASFEFADTQTGWISVQYPTGAAFSRGALYRTQDGGETWQRMELPAAGRARFADAQHGWLAGGVSGGELYATADGGLTWQPVSAAASDADDREQVSYGLPVLDDVGVVLLPAVMRGESGARLNLYAGAVGAEVWRLVSSAPIPGDGEMAPVLVPTGDGLWALPLEGGSLARIQANGQVSLQAPAGSLPEGWASIRFAGGDAAWAVTWSGECGGEKSSAGFSCEQRSGLSQSSDGGRSWDQIY